MLGAQEHSCAWMASVVPAHMPDMEENHELAAEIRQWLLDVMATTGLNTTTWAQKAGIARTTIARPIKPDYPFVTSSRTLSKLAMAAGVSAPTAAHSGDIKIVPAFLPVRFRVQAGNWIDNEFFDEMRAGPARPVSPDPRFAEWPQWLEEVVGDSVDIHIRPGGFAHVVDAIESGYSPRTGDFVVVERRRDQGRLRERTIKQVEITPEGVKLWPRSTNPAWAAPVTLTDGASANEEMECEIVGFVIGAYSSFV